MVPQPAVPRSFEGDAGGRGSVGQELTPWGE
jgi:hypothetical protein